jgi:hypothetical protein
MNHVFFLVKISDFMMTSRVKRLFVYLNQQTIFWETAVHVFKIDLPPPLQQGSLKEHHAIMKNFVKTLFDLFNSNVD